MEETHSLGHTWPLTAELLCGLHADPALFLRTAQTVELPFQQAWMEHLCTLCPAQL